MCICSIEQCHAAAFTAKPYGFTDKYNGLLDLTPCDNNAQVYKLFRLSAEITHSLLSGSAVGTCSGGKEWQECTSASPLTCDNYDRAPVHCALPCMEGCVCPEGKVELDGVCVDPSTCAGTFSIQYCFFSKLCVSLLVLC